MGLFFWDLLAGEVLFAEVLVTPTGISKGCGYALPYPFPHRPCADSFDHLASLNLPPMKTLNALFESFRSLRCLVVRSSFARCV